VGKRGAFVVSALLALAAAPDGTAVARTPLPALETNAQTLANIVLPREQFLAIRVPRFDAAYAEELKEDQRLQALEKTNPGIIEAVKAAAHDEAEKGYGQALTLLQVDVAKLYASKFTAEELGKLITFFSSETGQAMIIMSAASSGDTATEFETNRRAKALAFIQNPSDSAKRDLTMLMQSGLLPKVRAINPEISALSTRRFDDVSNIVEAALPARVEETIKAFQAKAK
jgi:Uncharacterized protein conserved in bacteria (DUF2059)